MSHDPTTNAKRIDINQNTTGPACAEATYLKTILLNPTVNEPSFL
jgi:hypothetical protein